MPKNIAIVSYDRDPSSPLTQDAIAVRDELERGGYAAELTHPWSCDETNVRAFEPAEPWERYDGIVICSFYPFWDVRGLVRAGRPVLCLNVGDADDLGLAKTKREHASEDRFNVVNNAHPITAGFSTGVLDIGNPVFFDAVSTLGHVDVLVTTLASQAVLVAHKTQLLAYFGWHTMARASADSPLFKLLTQAADWTFSDGPHNSFILPS